MGVARGFPNRLTAEPRGRECGGGEGEGGENGRGPHSG